MLPAQHIQDELASIERVIRAYRFRFQDEKTLQAGIEQALANTAFDFQREHRLSPKDIVDFLVAGMIGVEVKIDGPLSAVTRQLMRYAEHESIQALILVTNLSRLGNLPSTLYGKPLRVVHLARSFV